MSRTFYIAGYTVLTVSLILLAAEAWWLYRPLTRPRTMKGRHE